MVNDIDNQSKDAPLANPEASYEKDRAFLGQPFYFPGTNGKAVLLIHGWTSVPYELRRLGAFLNEKGYTVSGPVLRGHGTHPRDLKDVRWEAWLVDAEKAYVELKRNHKKVYIVGTSMGASLASILAARYSDASGIVLMAMPYRTRGEIITGYLVKLLSFFKTYQKKYYPPGFGDSEFITRKISYQTYPLESVLEVFSLGKVARKELPNITQPCFVMQSTSDHIVTKKSLENIFSTISSKVKRKKYIHKAYHTFISDIKSENVFLDILNFIEEN